MSQEDPETPRGKGCPELPHELGTESSRKNGSWSQNGGHEERNARWKNSVAWHGCSGRACNSAAAVPVPRSKDQRTPAPSARGAEAGASCACASPPQAPRGGARGGGGACGAVRVRGPAAGLKGSEAGGGWAVLAGADVKLPAPPAHPPGPGWPPPPRSAPSLTRRPDGTDRGWFELVRLHDDTRGAISSGAAARRALSVPSASAAASPLPALRCHLGPAVLRGRERGGRPAAGRALTRRSAVLCARPLRRHLHGVGLRLLCAARTVPPLQSEKARLPRDLDFLESCFCEELAEIPFDSTLVFLFVESQTDIRKQTMNSFTDEEFGCHFLDEGFTAKDILDQKINEVSSSDDKDAFYVADLGDILKKHLRWLKALPRVTPFYAVKCNDSRTVVKTLATIGTGFDCASKMEIQLVQSLGVPPERIIYANPCKQVSQIKYAANNGVQMMTFDSEVELMKVARAHPKAKLVLRIATDDSKAVCRLSVKFGATLKTSRLLLERAKELNVDVIGVSFHVGSGCTDPETFVQAISDARCVFDMGAEVGFNMHLLDIGGGFPGSEDVKLKFEEITSVINPALDKYFPPDSGVTVIAEPGRYYVASAFTLAVNIIAKKLVLKEQTGSDDEDESSEKTFMYYVNDGVYGSFNCILYDHAHVKPLLQKRPKPDEKHYSSSIWGPTCDGLDRIVERCALPEMHVGDWMLFENMGAYTVAAASTFNGFQRPTVYYVMPGPAWQLMQQAQNHDVPAAVEEQDVSALPVSCAWESGMERHPAACASARVNV